MKHQVATICKSIRVFFTICNIHILNPFSIGTSIRLINRTISFTNVVNKSNNFSIHSVRCSVRIVSISLLEHNVLPCIFAFIAEVVVLLKCLIISKFHYLQVVLSINNFFWRKHSKIAAKSNKSSLIIFISEDTTFESSWISLFINRMESTNLHFTSCFGK